MNLLCAITLWLLLAFGMTYLASRAEIFEKLRIRICAFVPFMALLLSCRACTQFWTGQVAAAIVMGITIGLGGSFPWHAWLYLPPVGGVAAVGAVDLLAFARNYGSGGGDGSA